MNKTPLVSICTTFFNAERYIHRLINSCLNQTYKNIEIVIVDDASTDNSEKVIRKYMARDSRIKYFKNNERTNIAECFLKMSHLANGDFAMTVGADDWLARDYIENGARVFLQHPDIAGVIPDLTSLFEYKNDLFTFIDRQHFPSGIHSARWFVKRIYKPIHFYVSGYALVRNKDLRSALDYYFKNYYRNTSDFIPEELKKFFSRVFGYDSMLFLEILSRYRKFAFDGSLNYIKIGNFENQTFDFALGSLLEIFKRAHYYLIIYKCIFERKWSKFYRGVKIYTGADMLSSMLIYFFRKGMRLSSFNFYDSKKHVNGFFRELSFFEIIMAIIYSVPMAVYRCIIFVRKKFIKKDKHKKVEESSVFIQENFLDSERHFKIS